MGPRSAAASPATRSLCPTVTKSRTALWLEVDSQSNQTLSPMLQASDSTPVPLHLGGLPGECDLSLGGGPALGDQALGSPALTPPSVVGRHHIGVCSNLSPFPAPQDPRTHRLGTPPPRTRGLHPTKAA